MNDSDQEQLSLSWFIREVAHRANFTQSDVKIIYRMMIEVIREVVADKKSLMLNGLFKMTFHPVHRKNAWDNFHKKRLGDQIYYRMKLSPSYGLRKLYYLSMSDEREESSKEDLE